MQKLVEATIIAGISPDSSLILINMPKEGLLLLYVLLKSLLSTPHSA